MLTTLLVVAGSVVLSMLAAYQVSRLRVSEGSEHNTVLGYFFSSLGAFYSFLLAFVVVTNWGSLRDAQANVYEEASNLPGMYHGVTVFSDEHRVPMQRTLREYAASVINHEWPAMAEGTTSREVETALAGVRREVLAMVPQNAQQSAMYGAMLDHISRLASARRTRLNHAQVSIPAPFWIALVCGGAMLVIAALGFHTPKTWMHMVLMMMLAFVVSSSLCLARTMDHPFQGGIRVSPTAFETALKQMDR